MFQDDQTWAAQAACATVEPDQLFGKGAEQRDARSLCFSCPVRMECLAEALKDDELVAEIHARRAPRILARVRCAS